MKIKTTYHALVIVAFLLCLGIMCFSESIPDKPNILYILADDLGYNDVSWTNPDMKTPVLESLARDGVILSHFYTQPKCSPSRAALMTGLYPHRTSQQRGSIGSFRPTGLATVFPTLPQLLKLQGYSTHLVGKWHLGYCHPDYTPVNRGFDTFFGSYAQQIDHFTRMHEVNQYIGAGYDLRRGNNVSHDGVGVYSTQLWTDETIAVMEGNNGEKPWFIELSLTAVHRPFQVPDRYINMYRDKRRSYSSSEYEMDVVRKGMITAIDENVGRIVHKLKEIGAYNNTLIIFTSDNGAGYRKGNHPLKGKKGSVHEGGVRVPAFLHGPPLTRARRRGRSSATSSAVVHITDWFPTLLRLAGNTEELETDGEDIWPVVTGRTDKARHVMVYNLDQDDQSRTFQYAVRQGGWKLIWGQTKEFKPHRKPQPDQVELFDLDDDPNERNNLARARSAKLEQMKELALRLAKDMRPAFQPNRVSLGFPRYHSGMLETGWCQPGWWKILWREKPRTDITEEWKK